MILCLDVGNSNIYAGVVDEGKILLRFRMASNFNNTSDQIGVFLKSLLHENGIDAGQIKQIAICSVVPSLDYSLRGACLKYFKKRPFILQAGTKTGLQIKYDNPLEVGADRIANAIAGVDRYPDENLMIVDFGTATTFCVISAAKEYLGGVITPGIRLAMESLQKNTAKLSSVEIIKPKKTVGSSTMESIQSGLYFSQLATIEKITRQVSQENFSGERPLLIGTGGFARLFASEKIFDEIVPDLVLDGLVAALRLNVD